MTECVRMKVDVLLQEIYGGDKHQGRVRRGESSLSTVAFQHKLNKEENKTQEELIRIQNSWLTHGNEPVVVSVIKRWGRRSVRVREKE